MVELPELRSAVIETIKTLSDVEYQRRVWINHQYPEGIQYDDFTLAVHILFDDAKLEDSPREGVGVIFRNLREAEAVYRVINAINQLFKVLGTERSDKEYINHPKWALVVKAAKAALQVLEEQG